MSAGAPATPEPVFSMRIVSLDHYMARPEPGLDVCYSDLEGTVVERVPVVRIFGATPLGQKTCLHLHKVLVAQYNSLRYTYPLQYLRVAKDNHATFLNVMKDKYWHARQALAQWVCRCFHISMCHILTTRPSTKALVRAAALRSMLAARLLLRLSAFAPASAQLRSARGAEPGGCHGLWPRGQAAAACPDHAARAWDALLWLPPRRAAVHKAQHVRD